MDKLDIIVRGAYNHYMWKQFGSFPVHDPWIPTRIVNKYKAKEAVERIKRVRNEN